MLSPHEKGQLASGWSKEAALARGERYFGSEIDLTFNIGGKSVGVRADVLTRLPDGRYVYIESKYSPAASYTKNQRQVIPQLVAAGDKGMTATIGARTGETGLLARGQQIDVVFQGDVWNSGPTLYGR